MGLGLSLAPVRLAFGADCAVESAAGQSSDRASPYPVFDQRETRLTMRVRDVATALMRCRSGLRRAAPSAGTVAGSRARRSRSRLGGRHSTGKARRAPAPPPD